MRTFSAAVLMIAVLAQAGYCIADELQENKPAPAITATLLNGSRFALAEQSGKVVIVSFWATWCAPCWLQLAALDEYYRKHRAQGLEIIAISTDEPRDEAKVREAMRKFSFPAAMLRDARVEGYGQPSTRLPVTFVVNYRGVLISDGRGKPGMELPALEWNVTPHLPGPPPRRKAAS